ncbi:MAG: hypothetical protein ACRDJY_09030 [Thermoleophilaceae bacterium]
MFAPMSIIVIIAGLLLADRLYDFDQTWLILGYIGWGISFLFGVGFYPREGAKREKLIEANGVGHELVAKASTACSPWRRSTRSSWCWWSST